MGRGLRGELLEITKQGNENIHVCSFFLFFFGGGGINGRMLMNRSWLRMEHVYVQKNEPEIIKIMHFLFYFNLYIFQFRVFLIKNSCQFLCLLHLMG